MRLDTPAALQLVRDFALAPLLVDVLGWTAEPAVAASPHDGPMLVPLARRGRRVALHHRTPLGGTFPDHAGRRAIRAHAAQHHADPLLVFTDALHTVQLWQWVERAPGRPPLLREQVHRPGDSGATLLRRLAALDAPAPAPLGALLPATLRAAVADAVLPALLRRVRRRCPAAFRPGGGAARVLDRDAPLAERALAVVEECDDPALLRALGHALATITVFDPACGRGDRLLAALALLEPLRDAYYERVQGWLAELDRPQLVCRLATRAADRGALALLAEADEPATRRAAIRAAIVRDNLFGADLRGARAATCAERLRRAITQLDAEARLELLPPTAPNVRAGDVRLGCRCAADVAGVELREAVELLARAAEVGTGTAADRVFLARQAALRDALDVQLARELGVDASDAEALAAWRAAHRPLHACIEWPAAARRGFDVVFDGSRAGAVRERRAGFGASCAAPERLRYLPRAARAYPARLAATLAEAAPALLTLRGDPALLEQPLLGLFASIEVGAGIALQTLEVARALREAGVAVVSGFQSPLERACLEWALAGAQPVVVCAARGIDDLRLPTAWRAPLEAGRLLLVSGFPPWLRRPTRELAAARNRHVAALAEQLLVAYATPGGKTHRLAAEWLRRGMPVHTLDDEANADLLLLGAQPIDAAGAGALLGGCAPRDA